MQRAIISDTSCLILLDKIEELNLLNKLFGARKFAEQLGLKLTGTLGVLINAKLGGHLLSIKPVLARIRDTNFRLTEELEQKILFKVGEN